MIDKSIFKYRSISIFYQTKTERAHLRCFPGWSNSPWLKLGPMKIELAWTDPQIVTFHELLYDEECDSLTYNLSAKLKTWNSIDTYAGGPWTDVRVMKKYKNNWTIIYIFFIKSIMI